jgi:unsaturated rhamnogalacturonyl hydrolase
VARAALLIEFNYQEGAKGPYKPVLRNVTMANITGENIPLVAKVDTFPGAVIENIRIENSTFSGLKSADPLVNGDGITYSNVTVTSNKKPKKEK